MTNMRKVLLLSLISALTAGVVATDALARGGTDRSSAADRSSRNNRSRRINPSASTRASTVTTADGQCDFAAVACLESMCAVSGTSCADMTLDQLQALMSAGATTNCTTANSASCSPKIGAAIRSFQTGLKNETALASSDKMNNKECILARMTAMRVNDCKNQLFSGNMNIFKSGIVGGKLEDELRDSCGAANVYVDPKTNANASFTQGTNQVLLGTTDDSVPKLLARAGNKGASDMATYIKDIFTLKWSTKDENWRNDVEAISANFAQKAGLACGSDVAFTASQYTVRNERTENFLDKAVNSGAEQFGARGADQIYDNLFNRKAKEEKAGSSTSGKAPTSFDAEVQSVINSANSDLETVIAAFNATGTDRVRDVETITSLATQHLEAITSATSATGLSAAERLALGQVRSKWTHFSACAATITGTTGRDADSVYKYKAGDGSTVANCK